MDTRVAVLADYANVTADGKLNIMGVFTTVHTRDVPAVIPHMVFVLQLETNLGDAGSRNIGLELVESDGLVLMGVSGQMEFNKPPDGIPGTANFQMDLNNLILPMFGRYEFRVTIDGERVETVPLQVKRIV